MLVAGNDALMSSLDWAPRFADIDSITAHALDWERKLRASR
jgi:UDP-glucose 4-epimerase